eukprot:CAMPEP_0183325282 /NCGR_PEP_ID=MMETSP0160_2-20130417/79156_1 /TAXON_ID=2839 ORGANISM="Odontella Sinensis, Strain Grunow 1884" /NCGR_SAMPLE_ID=MMETSP0160_2 /ASSEMBLY_ACC=CAM_ASM_000250 /LENGTH=101 /DNA_ID=CAMNT_0025493035 /DNA_START=52 /DNA_END=357 /DNA_ORIENTATION=-
MAWNAVAMTAAINPIAMSHMRDMVSIAQNMAVTAGPLAATSQGTVAPFSFIGNQGIDGSRGTVPKDPTEKEGHPQECDSEEKEKIESSMLKVGGSVEETLI